MRTSIAKQSTALDEARAFTTHQVNATTFGKIDRLESIDRKSLSNQKELRRKLRVINDSTDVGGDLTDSQRRNTTQETAVPMTGFAQPSKYLSPMPNHYSSASPIDVQVDSDILFASDG